MKIQNYILGNWEDGEGVELELHNAITGENFGSVSSAGLESVLLALNLTS